MGTQALPLETHGPMRPARILVRSTLQTLAHNTFPAANSHVRSEKNSLRRGKGVAAQRRSPVRKICWIDHSWSICLATLIMVVQTICYSRALLKLQHVTPRSCWIHGALVGIDSVAQDAETNADNPRPDYLCRNVRVHRSDKRPPIKTRPVGQVHRQFAPEKTLGTKRFLH